MNIQINENKLTNSKYLGFHIDNKLNFSFNFNYVYLSRLHKIMYSVFKILLIMAVIWGGISNRNIDSISIKINKIPRLIFNVKFEILLN